VAEGLLAYALRRRPGSDWRSAWNLSSCGRRAEGAVGRGCRCAQAPSTRILPLAGETVRWTRPCGAGTSAISGTSRRSPSATKGPTFRKARQWRDADDGGPRAPGWGGKRARGGCASRRRGLALDVVELGPTGYRDGTGASCGACRRGAGAGAFRLCDDSTDMRTTSMFWTRSVEGHFDRMGKTILRMRARWRAKR
jgi:hypothetical protein